MPLRVVHVTSTRYGIGGVERLLLDAARHWDPQQVRVSYCNLFCDANGAGVFPTALRSRGLDFTHVPGRRWLDLPGMVYRLARLFRQQRVDVVHTHMLHATIVGAVAAALARVPIRLITRHFTGEAYDGRRKAIRLLDQRATRSADHVVAVSGAVRRYLLSHTGVRAQRATIIYNGIDVRAFDASTRSAPIPWPSTWEGATLIVTVGSLTLRKGHRYLLEAMTEVNKHFSDARLVILGEGPERERLQTIAARLGIADHVSFVGFCSHVPAVLRRADLYVHPSVHEPFGMAVIEAMAAERAVVASAVGGIPEILPDEDVGLLVPPADSAALANAICTLLASPQCRKEMGARARQRVLKHFDIGTTVEAYQRLYFDLAERKERLPV